MKKTRVLANGYRMNVITVMAFVLIIGICTGIVTASLPAEAPVVTAINPWTGSNTTAISITNLAGSNFVSGAGVRLMPGSWPVQPVHRGKISNGSGGALLNGAHSVVVAGNNAYVISSNDNALEIVNVADPSAPVHRASVVNGTGGALLKKPRGLFVSGNYAYIASQDSNALEIVNIANPSSPVHAAVLKNGDGGAVLNGPENVYVSGTYAFVVNMGSNSLEIVDVSVPSNPFHVASIANSSTVHMQSPHSVYVSGNYAYVASEFSGLEIINIGNPSTPVHTGYIGNGTGGALLHGAYSVQVMGNYAYVVSYYTHSLEIIDISNPAAPVHAGNIVHNAGGAELWSPMSVFVDGMYAYVANQDLSSLGIIDVSNPALPVHKSKIQNGAGGANLSGANGVYVVNNTVYVASNWGKTLEILDVNTGSISGSAVNVASPARIACTFDLTDKPVGRYHAIVTNPDGHQGILMNGFTVTPVAFSGSPVSGPAPLTVSFTDISTNNPTGWAWYFGDETYTAPWTRVNDEADTWWTARSGQSTVVLPNGAVVMMGGNNGIYLNETWRSINNNARWMHWGRVNASSGWTARTGHSSVVMPDGSIVLMGGQDNSTVRNDVWRSTDSGRNWTLVNTSAGWSARTEHSSVVMPDDSIVLTGGWDLISGYLNDTWRSTDNGATWKRMNMSSGWPVRWHHSSVVMRDGSIVITGGYAGGSNFRRDTWRSTDNGATWTRMNASSGWSARFDHSSVVMPDGSIVLTGGQTIGGFENDTWRSKDNGATWTEVNASPGWSARYDHSSVVMPDGSILLLGGYDSSNSRKDDMWRLMPAGSLVQNPSHTYTRPGIYDVSLHAYNTAGFSSMQKKGYINVSGRKDEIGVFRNSTHVFYLDYNGNGAWNGASVDRQYNFGLTGDIPVSGDWNNDGITEIGVFRNSTHLFYLDYNGNGAWNGASVDRQYNFGLTGDIPVSGDWNNDGITEIGVFRNSTHVFYLDYNGNGAWNGASVDRQYNFGLTGDIPVSGDWNNDGITEIGVFRNSTHMFLLDYNGNGVWNGASVDRQYNFGLTGDIPVSGDWNNDRKPEIGVFRNSTHMFLLDYNGNGAWNGASVDRQYNFGLTGDKPIAGKWG